MKFCIQFSKDLDIFEPFRCFDGNSYISISFLCQREVTNYNHDNYFLVTSYAIYFIYLLRASVT